MTRPGPFGATIVSPRDAAPEAAPAPAGSIQPEGMSSDNPLPNAPDPKQHPSGGPTPQGNPPRPGALGVAQGPTAARDALGERLPEQIKPDEVARNVDRYGENSEKFWTRDKS